MPELGSIVRFWERLCTKELEEESETASVPLWSKAPVRRPHILELGSVSIRRTVHREATQQVLSRYRLVNIV